MKFPFAVFLVLASSLAHGGPQSVALSLQGRKVEKPAPNHMQTTLHGLGKQALTTLSFELTCADELGAPRIAQSGKSAAVRVLVDPMGNTRGSLTRTLAQPRSEDSRAALDSSGASLSSHSVIKKSRLKTWRITLVALHGPGFGEGADFSLEFDLPSNIAPGGYPIYLGAVQGYDSHGNRYSRPATVKGLFDPAANLGILNLRCAVDPADGRVTLSWQQPEFVRSENRAIAVTVADKTDTLLRHFPAHASSGSITDDRPLIPEVSRSYWLETTLENATYRVGPVEALWLPSPTTISDWTMFE